MRAPLNTPTFTTLHLKEGPLDDLTSIVLADIPLESLELQP